MGSRRTDRVLAALLIVLIVALGVLPVALGGFHSHGFAAALWWAGVGMAVVLVIVSEIREN